MDKRILIIGGIIVAVILAILIPFKEKSPQPVSAEANLDQEARELYTKAISLKKDRELAEARQVYKQILVNHPDTENIDEVQEDLEKINMELLFSNSPVPGKTVMHEVVKGDTLGKIAKEYGTTVDLIKKSNNLKNDIIRIGQKLRIWQGEFNIFVDKSQNILILKDDNEVMKVYNVSTGANNSTPVGEFKIVNKLVNPVWFNSGVIVPPESPENELGSRWLGFDTPGYGIHGTIKPESIGKQVTAGCVRMRNPEVEELYSIVPRGTNVVIVD